MPAYKDQDGKWRGLVDPWWAWLPLGFFLLLMGGLGFGWWLS